MQPLASTWTTAKKHNNRKTDKSKKPKGGKHVFKMGRKTYQVKCGLDVHSTPSLMSLISLPPLLVDALDPFVVLADRSLYCCSQWAVVTRGPVRARAFSAVSSSSPWLSSLAFPSQCGHGPPAATDPRQPQPLVAILAACQWGITIHCNHTCILQFSCNTWAPVCMNGHQSPNVSITGLQLLLAVAGCLYIFYQHCTHKATEDKKLLSIY